MSICWALAASSLAAYFYIALTTQSAPVVSTHIPKEEMPTQPAPGVRLGRVMLIVDYGNGTFNLYNITAQLPTTLFNLTAEVAEVGYKVYEGMGVFVTSINGVANDPLQSRYWTWWYWNDTRWVEGPVGAGQFEVRGGEVVCWYYSRMDPRTWAVEAPSSRVVVVGALKPSGGSAG